MRELLVELFSEEIPARMQARGAEDLVKAVSTALAPVLDGAARSFHGPRRIGLVATLRAEVTTKGKEERGPRIGAPDAAIVGFLKKHGAARAALVERGGFWVLDKPGESVTARDLVARSMPGVIRGLAWPKSMRWGTGGFTWVRPLQRILCLLDGEVVRFDLRYGDDAAHGLASSNLTEGHRVMAPGAFEVASFAAYKAGLRERRVILDAAERMRMIEDGLEGLAARHGVAVVPDRGLVEEVASLVEWPVPLLGRIDDAFMDLPPELMRTTMRVNQRYFAMVTPDGRAAPCFGVVANIAATDGGAALVAGNERVLRARLADARFFWDQDRKQALEDFLPKLDEVVFHAKLGTQGQRVARLERLARFVAAQMTFPDEMRADPNLAARAARIAKADLASGMVGEFPELQGVMGRYYAEKDGENPFVSRAIADHYRPAGAGDDVPRDPVSIAVAIADRADLLAGFFAINKRPTGSGDPYSLRRAALGLIRILRENRIRMGLTSLFAEAFRGYEVDRSYPSPDFGQLLAREVLDSGWVPPRSANSAAGVYAFAQGVTDFVADRLRVQLRGEGARHDLVAAAFSAGKEDDVILLCERLEALRGLVESGVGEDLLTAYRRAANILRAEERKDGPRLGGIHHDLLRTPAERDLARALMTVRTEVDDRLVAREFTAAMRALAALRGPVDAFFEQVTVNDADPTLRVNRLRLLLELRTIMDVVADFSKVEGRDAPAPDPEDDLAATARKV